MDALSPFLSLWNHFTLTWVHCFSRRDSCRDPGLSSHGPWLSYQGFVFVFCRGLFLSYQSLHFSCRGPCFSYRQHCFSYRAPTYRGAYLSFRYPCLFCRGTYFSFWGPCLSCRYHFNFTEMLFTFPRPLFFLLVVFFLLPLFALPMSIGLLPKYLLLLLKFFFGLVDAPVSPT